MDSEYLDPQQCADILSVKKRTFLERYAPRPDIPRANIRIEETFLVEKRRSRRMARPPKRKTPDDVICTTFTPSVI